MGVSAGVSPGPMFALIVSQSVRHGAREGMKVAAAPALTDIPIILASTFLLSRIGDFKPALGIVSIAGALLLFKLAYETARSVPAGPEVAVDG
ncbi:MAG TPA: LysE family transporter, partial [Candidatus Deferrimicrobiaceae bacterium]